MMRMLSAVWLWTLLLILPAFAQIQVDITKATREPLPIAVMDFTGGDAQGQQIGRDIAGVIRANLERSALFRSVSPTAFIQKSVGLDETPRHADWRVIKAQALVVGAVTTQADGRLRIEFRLWDVINEQQLTKGSYTTVADNWRRIAHIISDDIYETLTGETGYFDTRIVFISESGPKTRRVKRLAIMDQDGANPSFLTDGRALVLTPRFSPRDQLITYMSYADGVGRVYLFNIQTGRQEVLGNFPGMTFAPRFSPDGDSVVFTLEQRGNSDIWRMDLRTRARSRLTDHPGIDTSPSFSSDGSQIVFNSDRGGSPQLYVMSANGGGARRISFGEGRYTTPVWSPRGDLIAFTKQVRGGFQIGIMAPDGSKERVLTNVNYLDEGPTWSPNGRVIMFFRESGPGRGPQLWSVDLFGNEKRIQTPGDASDPAWSPLLP